MSKREKKTNGVKTLKKEKKTLKRFKTLKNAEKKWSQNTRKEKKH